MSSAARTRIKPAWIAKLPPFFLRRTPVAAHKRLRIGPPRKGLERRKGPHPSQSAVRRPSPESPKAHPKPGPTAYSQRPYEPRIGSRPTGAKSDGFEAAG